MGRATARTTTFSASYMAATTIAKMLLPPASSSRGTLMLVFPMAGLRPSFEEPRSLLVVAPFWAGLAAAPGYACVVISRWTATRVSYSERIWVRTSVGLGLLASVGGLLMSGSFVPFL